MDAKVGDRVSLDAKKVGQPRRAGVIVNVAQGLSGARYEIAWEEGSTSILSPGAGTLIVEGKAKAKAKAKGSKPKAKTKKKK